jgi:hypothetical protein
VLRRIFGPKRNEVTGEWRRIHNDELPGDEIKKTKMGRKCSTYGESRGAYGVLVGKPEGRNYLEKPDVDWRIILKWILEE